MIKTVDVGTDFSGIGSPEEAIKEIQEELNIKFNNVFACDIDKYVRKSYNSLHQPKIMYEDITKRDHSEVPKLGLYIAGFPCQAFSIAGKQKGFEDVRGTLFFNVADFIRINQPESFILENVKGLLSHDKGRTFQTIIDLLSNGSGTVNGQMSMDFFVDGLGYHIYYKVLNTKEHGIPQNRERIFIVGFKESRNYSFPIKEPLKLKLKDLLEDEVDEKYYLSEQRISTLIKSTRSIGFTNTEKKDIANCLIASYNKLPTDGEYIKVNSATKKGYEEAKEGDSINYSVPTSKTRRGRVGKGVAQTLDTSCNQAVLVSKVVRTEAAKKQRRETGTNDFQDKKIDFIESDTMNCITTASTKDNLIKVGDIRYDKGIRIRKDGASPCLCSQGDAPIVIKDKIRRLTPLECWRLQGFSDESFYNAQKVNSDTQLYKQAGNSMTKHVIKKVIMNIYK